MTQSTAAYEDADYHAEYGTLVVRDAVRDDDYPADYGDAGAPLDEDGPAAERSGSAGIAGKG